MHVKADESQFFRFIHSILALYAPKNHPNHPVLQILRRSHQMNFQEYTPNKSVLLFVRSIMVFKELNNNQKTILPFFADGYPGLVFYEAPEALIARPHNKKMPDFFLYGQTLKPMELMFESNFQMIVFQFYPFILKNFFCLTPKTLNDGCYNLLESGIPETETILQQLQSSKTTENRIEIITTYLYSIFLTRKKLFDPQLKQALQLIIDNKGQIPIQDLCREIKMNERTFGRRFTSETGLLPKQFARILQFQSSLEQLSIKDYNKLTDIVYQNGYADQSHFIKVFKTFTGKTPKLFLKK